ncbi:MAG: biotin/lipoyl-containing protein, partial [Aquificaceae bacterium]
MDYEIVMPQFSDTMEKGKVVKWLKKEGEFVEKGDVIAQIEAEKAVMELQSFKRGVLKRILAKEGEEIDVGKPIAILELGEVLAQVKPQVSKEEKPPMPQEKPPKVIKVRPPEEKRMELAPGFASPYARILAKEKGVDLHQLQREERIPSPAHAKDIEEFLKERYFTPKALELIKDYPIDIEELLKEFPNKKIDEDLLLTYIEEKNIPKKVPLSSVQKSL